MIGHQNQQNTDFITYKMLCWLRKKHCSPSSAEELLYSERCVYKWTIF